MVWGYKPSLDSLFPKGEDTAWLHLNLTILGYIQGEGVIKKDKSEIALCFAKPLNLRCFFIKIDCFGTYNLEYTEK